MMTPTNRRRRKLGLGSWAAAAFVVALFALAADTALACSVCTGIQEEASRKAFVGTTALLTFLPLILVGIAASFFVRHTLARERQEEDRRLEGIDPEAQRAR